MINETITILIVDDQPSNLKFLARLLQNQGYRVRRAISGELALNAAFASPPDLILLDILMPEINGYEVCERLKKDRRTENIPIIFISVIDRADEKVRAFKAGGVDYITKPFQANEVLARIDHQLTICKLQQQLETQNTQLKAEINQRSIAQQETQLLLELSRSFTRCPDFETALEEALSRLCQTIDAAYAEAWIEKDAISLKCASTWSGNQQTPDQVEAIAKFQQNSEQITLDKAQGLIGRVWHQCQPEWLHDLAVLSPDIFTRDRLARESGFKTVLAVPVTNANFNNNQKSNPLSPEAKPKVLAVLAFFSTDRKRDRRWFDLVATIAAQLGTIVQQKQAEENLRISEEKFAKAFRSSPHAIALETVPEGRYLDANESFFELLDYNRSEIIGFRARDLDIWVHPQQRDRFHRQLAEQNGILRNLEVEFRTKFGQIKTLLLSAELINLQGQNCVTLVTNDISDRKKLEEEVAQQKRFLNAIIDYLPIGLYVKEVNNEMRYLIWNQFSERALGVPRADLLGRNNWEVFPEELAHSWQEEDRELLRVKQAIVYPEQEVDNPDRQIKMWLQTTKAPIVDESGEISHILGIFNDISERHRTAIALRESEKKYRDLVETSQDIIWSMDRDGCYTFVNPAMTRICGYELEEIIGRPFWDFIPPSEHRANTPKFLRVLKGKPLMQHEQKYLAKNDRWIYLQVNAIAVYDELGQAIGVTGTATDITERKRVEEALRESVEREVAIATIIERMRRTLDIETIFSTTTQELRRVLNCDRVMIYRFNSDWSGDVVAEAVGAEWIPLIDQDRDRLAITTDADGCVVKQLHETIPIQDTHLQKTKGGGYHRGTRYLCIEDIYREKFAACYIKLLETFQARAYLTVPIFTSVQENENDESQPAPKLWGLLASYQNSAPRHWQEEEINIAIQIGTQMGIALQQAELLAKTQQQSEALKIAKETADAGNRAKSEFLANMSHELRTPLNAILGFTQLMVRDDSLDLEHQENLNIINRSGEHLLALINDVLEMSKIEAGRATFNADDFNLYRLLDSVEDMLRMKANSKGLQLICDRDRSLPQYVSTDAQKLRQILINLLSNAIKFTDTGLVTLRVKKKKGNQKLYFEVEDTGCGIASEDIEKIFEAFGQTKDGAKSSEGTGLGLPISQQFVRLMGGELDLDSERGRGSKFFFEIPIDISQEHTLESSISSKKNLRAIAPPDFPDRVYRILVVEDREYNRLLLLNLLTSLGFEVETANNGVEAIALWESWQPHFIWMDIRMPVMDGYEATRQIRLQEEELGKGGDRDLSERVPIVALTASAFLEDREKALAAGCDDFLSKPFQEDELLAKIEKYLVVQYLDENENETISENDLEGCDSESLLEDLQVIGDNELSPLSSALQAMPENWRKKLYDASIQCSDRLIHEAIAEIPEEHSSLAIALAHLVEEFRFDLVMELTKQATE